MIAAESLGLGTVCIAALRSQSEAVAKLLQPPPRTFAQFGIVVGRPDPGRPSAIKPWLPQQVVLHEHHCSPDHHTAAIAGMTRSFGLPGPSKDPQGRVDRAGARQDAGPASSHERDALKTILEDRELPVR